MEYEYRVVPAPRRLRKIKGVNSTPELFAATLTDAINAEARQGWEYVRAESLAAEGPSGWLRRGAVVEATMMIFRRPRQSAQDRSGRTGEPLLARPHDREETAERAEAFAPVAPVAERNRPPTGPFVRGESPRTGPFRGTPSAAPPPGAGSAKPPSPSRLSENTPSAMPPLRPVPRHEPGDRS